MTSIFSCKISIPEFSTTPGPQQEEEIRQAAEEMACLSSDVSFFKQSDTGALESTPRLSTVSGVERTHICDGITQDFRISMFAQGFTDDLRTEEPEFGSDDAGPPLTFHLTITHIKAPLVLLLRHVDGTNPDGSDQPSSSASSQDRLPFRVVPKLHPPFVVYADEILRASKGGSASVHEPFKTEKHDIRPVKPKPIRREGKENVRPAIRRKPVPKVVLDDKIRTPSFMKFSSMNSFPVLWQIKGNVDNGGKLESLKTYERTDAVRNYILTQFLSQGAQGKVYLAKSKESNKISAIKVISKLALESYHTLLQEQKLLKRIKGHRFVLDMVDSFHDMENFYLVTIVAVKFLHGNGIVHRDLKPGNILIKADGHICVVDFGLCKDFTSKQHHSSRSRAGYVKSNRQTPSGPTTDGFAGTLVYMSPQVVCQELYSYETDWWSTGVVLYELLQGDTPWVGSDLTCMMRKIKKEPVIFRTLGIDADAKDFVLKLLEKQVEKRIAVSDFQSHPFFDSIKFPDVEAGLLKPPYIPNTDDDIPPAPIRNREKIYVGRRYKSDVDPFPEYNYDYQPPEHNFDLEDIVNNAKSFFPFYSSKSLRKPNRVSIQSDLPTAPRTKTSRTSQASALSVLKLGPWPKASSTASRADIAETLSSATSDTLFNLARRSSAILAHSTGKRAAADMFSRARARAKRIHSICSGYNLSTNSQHDVPIGTTVAVGTVSPVLEEPDSLESTSVFAVGEASPSISQPSQFPEASVYPPSSTPNGKLDISPGTTTSLTPPIPCVVAGSSLNTTTGSSTLHRSGNSLFSSANNLTEGNTTDNTLASSTYCSAVSPSCLQEKACAKADLASGSSTVVCSNSGQGAPAESRSLLMVRRTSHSVKGARVLPPTCPHRIARLLKDVSRSLTRTVKQMVLLWHDGLGSDLLAPTT
ncbi:kinase-like protein [Coprinopsis marcescibilis]|uniref:Kinase-like protein n=1 Tax=Coprinopsis marcescibilis TaxID=230819 RepID=A0A5C3LG55_COPMA|nr:kinase-like protein [Coprinopsis marcescibilis]